MIITHDKKQYAEKHPEEQAQRISGLDSCRNTQRLIRKNERAYSELMSVLYADKQEQKRVIQKNNRKSKR